MRFCVSCGQPISPERLELLPETETCTKHSTVKKVQGLMDYGHKTAPALVMLPDDPEQIRLAYRSFRRAR